jgi:hypothetical protein
VSIDDERAAPGGCRLRIGMPGPQQLDTSSVHPQNPLF